MQEPARRDDNGFNLAEIRSSDGERASEVLAVDMRFTVEADADTLAGYEVFPTGEKAETAGDDKKMA